MVKFVPSIAVAVGLIALSELVATSAQAASLDFTDWTTAGDVSKGIGSATITNAKANNKDSDSSNLNFSFTNPLFPRELAEILGLPIDAPGSSAKEGSGIYTDLTVGAGDVFSFNWSAFNADPRDRLFAAIGSNTFDLTDSTVPYTYTFTSAGTFRVGAWVIDQDDAVKSSVLLISNADLTTAQAVPSPALLPAMVGFGLSLIRKRRSID
jgi:hypothetical protein